MHSDWLFLVWGAFVLLIGLSKTCAGLSERPRNVVALIDGSGHFIAGGVLGSLALLDMANRTTPTALALAVPVFVLGGTLMELTSLLKDQQVLKDRPGAWGNPPTFALMPERDWALMTGVLAVILAVAGAGVWPTDGLSRALLGMFGGLAAVLSAHAWIRARFRRRAPQWLARMAQLGASPIDQA